MNAKKLSISIILVIFVLFGAISAIVYDKSDSVDIICYEGSYAEEYAKEHNIDLEIISDSDAYIGILNLENFDYNNDGTIVAYKGNSEKIAIPTEIKGVKITKVSEKAFENAKNLKSIYVPKSVTTFEAKPLENVAVYMYEDTDLYKNLSKDEAVKFEIKTIPDSYYVDFYTANIPFSYDNISDKSIDINRYYGYNEVVFIPESVDGKIVTAISFDALANGVETIVIPKSVTSIKGNLYSNRYDLTFLIGMLIAFVGTIIAVAFVLALKVDTKEKMFLNISQFKTAYIVTILSAILGGVYLFVAAVPDFIVYIAAILAYALAVISIIKAKMAVSVVAGIDEKIKVHTFFIKTLTVDAQHLMNASKTAELKALTKKVYEAVRYSDPMSNAALVEVEDKIKNGFVDFENAVNAEDYELAASTAAELISLIDVRNKKCKLLK
ncbi:MAG: hypothetical protein E7526_01270 [Ruminococcaceae bacterium]|nr:hypothetical protein [Oscillospiraceae bacterium]